MNWKNELKMLILFQVHRFVITQDEKLEGTK